MVALIPIFEKKLNHKQDLMKDIKACNKNSELRKADLD